MRSLRHLIAGLAAGLLAACGGGLQDDVPDGPFAGRDVVVVVVDTLRADHLSFGGYPKETAPFLAHLAAEGAVFPKAFSGSSWTAPATASMFTSLHPDHHGVTTGLHLYERHADGDGLRLNRIPSSLQTLPELMRSAGYRTFGAADNPNINAEMGFARGFDHFSGGLYRGAAAVNADVLAWREALAADDRPAFLYLHYMDPHRPYHERSPYYGLAGTRAAMEEHRANAAAYDSEIGYLDAHLAELFAELGLDRGALVVLTADHGEEFGDHGSSDHGVTVHEELLRVPFVFGGWDAGGRPHFAPGERLGAVSTLDLLPTLRELVGLDPVQVEEGLSLAPRLLDPGLGPPGQPRTLFAHRKYKTPDKHRELFAVIEGDWRLQVDVVGMGVKLFNLRRDPGSQVDVAGRHRAVTQRLLGLLNEHRGRARLHELEFAPPRRLGEEEAAGIGDLGYTD
ncbi:MAG: sulfatase [Planctomycetota bacterium]|nr:sulfatase [Planctomycetota bacterium]